MIFDFLTFLPENLYFVKKCPILKAYYYFCLPSFKNMSSQGFDFFTKMSFFGVAVNGLALFYKILLHFMNVMRRLSSCEVDHTIL